LTLPAGGLGGEASRVAASRTAEIMGAKGNPGAAIL
jgi:hypothetical protein